MTRKYEKEYRKFVMNLSTWMKKTKERIEMLPQMEKLSQLTYEQWYEIFKEQALVKKVPSPPDPPESSIPKPEKHSCRLCKNFHTGIPPHDNWCDKKHSGFKINKTNNCVDYE